MLIPTPQRPSSAGWRLVKWTISTTCGVGTVVGIYFGHGLWIAPVIAARTLTTIVGDKWDPIDLKGILKRYTLMLVRPPTPFFVLSRVPDTYKLGVIGVYLVMVTAATNMGGNKKSASSGAALVSDINFHPGFITIATSMLSAAPYISPGIIVGFYLGITIRRD
jgi:hypothetical protein